MAHTHHALDYVEINVTDLAATKAFYSAAFGWAFNDYGPDYAGIQSPDGDGEVGGLNGMLLWMAVKWKCRSLQPMSNGAMLGMQPGST